MWIGRDDVRKKMKNLYSNLLQKKLWKKERICAYKRPNRLEEENQLSFEDRFSQKILIYFIQIDSRTIQ